MKKITMNVLLLFFAIQLQARIYYVSTTGAPSNNAQSWSTATSHLQNAINAASAGDEIWVAAGTYYPTEKIIATVNDDRLKSFKLKDGVKIYGGFAGTETALADRNFKVNETILSGNLQDQRSSIDNSYHVVLSAYDSNNTLLDGFTIQDGYANNYSYTLVGNPSRQVWHAYGAGLHLLNSSLQIKNVIVKNNYAETLGAGLLAKNSNHKVTNSVFTKNRCGSKGGGVLNDGSNVTYHNVVFYNNTAPQGGAGYNSGGNNIYMNCTFYDNRATTVGGVFQNNNVQNTIITNCILWENKLSGASNVHQADNNGGGTITYSITQPGSAYNTGTGVLNNVDPLFVDPSNPKGADGIWMTEDDGLNLQSTSPTIDVGNNANTPDTDILNNRRIINASVDYGAYEYGSSNTVYYVSTTGSDNDAGTTWNTAFATIQKAINAASAGDQIWVKAGTYYPTVDPTTSTNQYVRARTFLLKDNVGLYGGFAGTETLLADRDSRVNETILSGNLGNRNATYDNCYHVVTSIGNVNTILDGFTIQDGNANVSSQIYINSKPISTHDGAGLYLKDTDLKLRNVIVRNNSARRNGGGMNVKTSTVKVTNAVFHDNKSDDKGGGVINDDSDGTYENVIFYNNSAEQGGAGYNNGGNTVYMNGTFYDNKATIVGGVFQNNNTQSTIITNCIFWENKLNGASNVHQADNNGGGTITYTITQPGSAYNTGTGVLNNVDPLFIDPTNPKGADGIWMTEDDGLNMKRTSPALNTGDNTNVLAGDITGAQRIIKGTVDLGAYENRSLASLIYVSKSGSDSNDGTSWSNAFLNVGKAIASASSGDEIWIAKGKYIPTSTTFRLKDGVSMYGGFAGTETALEDRDFIRNQTILSGNIGQPSWVSDNCGHVITADQISTTTIFDGFTVQDGYGNSRRVSDNDGAGFYLTNTNELQISNVIIKDNYCKRNGAGIMLKNSTVKITNAVFHDNKSDGKGGGVINDDSTVTYENVVFYNNSAEQGGAGYNNSGNNVYTNCTFYDNKATTVGGGFQNSNFPITVIKNCIFWENKLNGASNVRQADNNGGGTITYTITQPGSAYDTGTGVLNNVNPSFVDPSNPKGADGLWMTADDGLRLHCSSPATNAGTSTTIDLDITGAIREQGITDLGAYETTQTLLSNTTIPTAPGLYTSEQTIIDGNWKHYCTCSGDLLLSLKEGTSGAVIPDNGVSVKVGATPATYYASGVGFVQNPAGAALLNRTWDVNPTTQPSGEVGVMYYFPASDFADLNTAITTNGGTALTSVDQMSLYKVIKPGSHLAVSSLNAGDIVELANGTSSSTTNWVLGSHNGNHSAEFKVTSFSGGGGGGATSGQRVLPVEWLSFEGLDTEEGILLSWSTALEVNNAGYHIERSIDGYSFERIGYVNGMGTTTEVTDYTYIDTNAQAGGNYYRLVQEDYDGLQENSFVIQVKKTVQGNYKLYPNPVSGEMITLEFNNSMEDEISIELYNISGQKIKQFNRAVTQGHNRLGLNIGNIDNGVYILRFKSDGYYHTQRLIKQ